MALSAKALREKRKQLADKAKKDLLEKAEAENRDLTAEEQAEWTRIMGGTGADGAKIRGEVDALLEQVQRAERVETLQAEFERPIGDPAVGRSDYRPRPAGQVSEQTRSLAIQAWFRCHTTRRFALTSEHEEACAVTGIDPHGEELVLRLGSTESVAHMQRAWLAGSPSGAVGRAHHALQQYGATLSGVSLGSGGSIMQPESMTSQMEINMLAYGGILQASEIMRTEGRERIRWPTASDTGNKGRRLGESQVVTNVDPTFGGVYWDAYKYTSDEILVPYELLTGTPFNLPMVLGGMMGERIGRKAADDLTTGSGANQPKGLATAAGTYAAPSATAIAWDDLESLISAVDPAYRTGASFMFHDSIRGYLKKLKDGMGRPLWQDGPNGSEPADLKGYPWLLNQSMDSTIASGKKTISFGRHSQYKVRMVGVVRIYRLVERHRENDQDAFLAFAELDGNLLTAGTDPVKMLTH